MKLSDFFSKSFNTLFNPLAGPGETFDPPDWFRPLGGAYAKEKARVLMHTIGIVLGYGGGAYTLRKLGMRMLDKERKDYQQKMREYIAGENIVFDPDPDTRDTRQEQRLEYLGIPKFKTKAPAGIIEKESADLFDVSNYRYLFPVFAALFAAKYGYGLAEERTHKKEEKAIDKETAKLENELEKETFEEMLKSKGIDPKTGKPLNKEAFLGIPLASPFEETSEEYKKELENAEPGTFDWFGAMLLLAMGLSGYTAYNIADEYFSEHDPNRIKLKQMKKEMENQWLLNRPATLVPVIDPRLKKLLDNQDVGAPIPKPKKVKLKGTKSLPTDPSDPLAGALSQV